MDFELRTRQLENEVCFLRTVLKKVKKVLFFARHVKYATRFEIETQTKKKNFENNHFFFFFARTLPNFS